MMPLFLYGGEIPKDLSPRLAQLAQPPAEAEVATLTDEDLPEIVGAEDDGEGGEPLRRVATEALVRHDLPDTGPLAVEPRCRVGAER